MEPTQQLERKGLEGKGWPATGYNRRQLAADNTQKRGDCDDDLSKDAETFQCKSIPVTNPSNKKYLVAYYR